MTVNTPWTRCGSDKFDLDPVCH